MTLNFRALNNTVPKADQKVIKRLIKASTGFDAVN